MSWNGRFDGHQNPPPPSPAPPLPVTPPDQRRPPVSVSLSPSMSPNFATILTIFPGTTRQVARAALDLASNDLEEAVQRLLDGRDFVEQHAAEMEDAEKEKIAGRGEGKPDDPVTFSDSEGDEAEVKEGSLGGGELEEREREIDNLPVGGAGGRWAEDASEGGGSVAVKEKELRGGENSNESGSEESGVPTERQLSVGRESSASGIAESSSNGDENDDSVDDEDEDELTKESEVNIWYVLPEGTKFNPKSVRGAKQLYFLEGGFPDIPVRDHIKALRTTNGYLGRAVKILEKIRADNGGQIGVDIQPQENGPDDEHSDSVGGGPSGGGSLIDTKGKRRSRDERGDDDDEDDPTPPSKRHLASPPVDNVVSNELDLEDALVTVVLKDGVHPTKFGKGMLWRVFAKFSLPKNFGPAKDFDEQVQNIELPHTNREVFDTALLWSREKRLKFGAKTTEADKYTIILDTVEFGEGFGLTGVGVALTRHLERKLVAARKENPQVDMTAFTADHILKVFGWNHDDTYTKPMQDLVIRALVRPFLVWEQQEDDITDQVREAIQQPLTDVQKKSFKELGFKFPAVELHEGFANAMRKAAIKTWHGREKKRENANANTRPERKTTTWILDPLTETIDYID